MTSPYQKLVFESHLDDAEAFQKKEKALYLAHNIRKFEINLFWKRGTYYWAFIAASFTAYVYISFGKESSDPCQRELLLLITSFLGLFFSISWILINKGSKFWQKNWEAHINELEFDITGNLHKTFLNTHYSSKQDDADDFSKSPLNFKAYDFSVTKITMLGSLVISVISGILFLYQILDFVEMECEIFPDPLLCRISVNGLCCIFIFIVLLVAFLSFKALFRTNGNTKEQNVGGKQVQMQFIQHNLGDQMNIEESKQRLNVINKICDEIGNIYDNVEKHKIDDSDLKKKMLCIEKQLNAIRLAQGEDRFDNKKEIALISKTTKLWSAAISVVIAILGFVFNLYIK